jgi:hypothetical protein
MEQVIKEIEKHLGQLNLSFSAPNIYKCGAVTFATYLTTNKQTLDEEVMVVKIWDGQYRLYVEI